jgi:hypothetical protein
MRSDIALGVVTFLMAVLGGIVSAHAPQKIWQKVLYASAFVLLGVVGLFFVVKQSNETAVASADLTNALGNLGKSTAQIASDQKETVRIQSENTALQERLLAQSGMISKLAEEGINSTTGGSGYCYMSFPGNTMGLQASNPIFLNMGKFPLYDISARIVDLVKEERLKESNKNVDPIEAMALAGTKVIIQHLAVNAAYSSGVVIPFTPDAQQRSFNIFFDARNGFWSEELRYRFVSGHWTIAYRMSNIDPKTHKRVEVVSNDFPRGKNGDVDWDYKPVR